MGLFRRRTHQSAAVSRALVAAARRIDAESKEDSDGPYLKRLEGWQERAWFYFGTIPEVAYAARYFANGLSRLRLVPAITIAGSAQPAILEPEGDPKLGYTAADAAVCQESIDRLRGPQGGQSEILRRFGLNLFAPGDSLLMGRDDEAWGGERWDVYSTSQLTLLDGKWQLREPPTVQRSGAQGQVRATWPKDEVVVIRIWRSHPQFDTWSDSPMRASEMILDELLVLTKAINAVATSRLAGPGIMFLPSSMRNRFGDDTADSGDGNALADDQFIIDIVDTVSKTIGDPGLASAQVPNFVFVPDEVYEQVGSEKLVQWSRELDEVMEKQRASLLDRWATVIDSPKEALKGLSELSHWTAANVPEEAFRAHYAPAANVIVDGLTTRFHWPFLREQGTSEVERFVMWYDASLLVGPPDQSKNYTEAYDRLEVSGDAYRAALGIGDDEKPEDDEIAERLLREQIIKRGQSPDGPQAPPTPMPRRTRPQAVAGPPRALAAATDASIDDALAGLPSTLALMDSTLLTQMLAAADAAMRRALERANVRVVSLANRRPELRGAVKGLQPSDLEVIPALGPAVIDQLAVPDELLAGAFDRFGIEFARRTGRAADEAVRLAAAAGELSEADARLLLEEMDRDRDAAWDGLLAALVALAAVRMFAPEPEIGPGEVSDTLVPPGAVRDALARAGGGGENAAGMMTGERITEAFRRAGIGFAGYRWSYGDPAARRTVFEPHRQIDGLGGRDGEEPLSGREDPRLRVSVWPFNLWPLDHAGCLCSMERVIAVRIRAEPPTIRDAQEVA